MQSWRQHAQHTHKPREDKFPTWRKGGGHKCSTLAEATLAFGCFWEQNSQLSLMMWPLGVSTTLQGHPHALKQFTRENWTR